MQISIRVRRDELDWSHVERSRKTWDPNMPVDLKVDSVEPLSMTEHVLSIHLASVD
jgi:hypothetical protein